MHRLEVDPSTTPIVERICREFLRDRGLFAIAQGLTGDDVPSPSVADPKRNKHRSGITWSKNAVRTILDNPRYAGREVWNTQRRYEVLLDVDHYRCRFPQEYALANKVEHPLSVYVR